MHWGPPGTWNLQKLHFELKYLGKNVADARLEKRKIISKFKKFEWKSLKKNNNLDCLFIF